MLAVVGGNAVARSGDEPLDPLQLLSCDMHSALNFEASRTPSKRLREVSFFGEVIVICQSQCLLETEPADLKVAVLHEDELRVHGVKWHVPGRYGLACIRPAPGRP